MANYRIYKMNEKKMSLYFASKAKRKKNTEKKQHGKKI